MTGLLATIAVVLPLVLACWAAVLLVLNRPPGRPLWVALGVLELVLLYLGGSLALLFNGPGRFSFDAGIVPALLDDLSESAASDAGVSSGEAGELCAIPISVNSGSRG